MRRTLRLLCICSDSAEGRLARELDRGRKVGVVDDEGIGVVAKGEASGCE